MKRFPLPLLALPLLLSARPAAAQTPAAPELVVNTTTLNAQAMPALSTDARRTFVVVWQSNLQDGSSYGVFGRRFSLSGASLGGEFRANTLTAGSQADPDVAVDARGDFVVAWTDYQGGPEIKARRFDRSGAAVGDEFRANAYVTSIQAMPAVAIDPAGNFVVVWQSSGQDGNGYGVFGHRYDVNGASLGADFQVNTYVTGNQANPDVAYTADGGFVVVFQGPDASTNGVHARRFGANGAPVGAEFSLTVSGASQFSPALAPLPQGGFVVAWTAYGQDGSHNGIFGRLFSAAGAPITGEIAVNTYTTNAQSFPAVAADGQGGFVVVWESVLQDGSDAGVAGQRFDASGARRGAEFLANTVTAGAQMAVAVAADSAGNFVTAWDSAQDGSGLAVVGRPFQGLVPFELAVDIQGNDVLEANQTARVAPTWLNGTVATQTFQGALSNFTGPLPASYSITDGLANYGATPPGAPHSCTDGGNCYDLTITAGSRPVQHWDASVLETLSGPPNAAGLQRRWVLHVGDSFADVPRTNPFYRFVETLLHHSVTGGCTATTYCPGQSTTREAMAVFVLVAREGPTYLPAACGTPVFPDVPASSPFCRWIEELARRGVVGGCGGGNYCPSDAVTREQMAVFVLRALDPTLNPQACAPPNLFGDVPETSPFCRWIEELARRGVVSGCSPGLYCPTQPVTREQMGVFLSLTFGLSLYGV
jgi:hypothetical protein